MNHDGCKPGFLMKLNVLLLFANDSQFLNGSRPARHFVSQSYPTTLEPSSHGIKNRRLIIFFEKSLHASEP